MPKTDRPVIILFFYRFMEFRLFFQTNMINLLQEDANVVVVVPDEVKQNVQKVVNDNVTVEGSSIGKLTVLDEFKKGSINDFIARILAFVYTKKIGKPHNITPKLHLKAIIERAHEQGKKAILETYFIVLLSKMASHFYFIRKLLQQIYAWTVPRKNMAALFKKYKPNLVVVGSFGVSADGWVMVEAKKQKVPTVVVLQSWDRTSSKGYPTVTPDYLLTWSHVTADEAHYFLDIQRQNIFIEGAPLWDDFFVDEVPISKADFFKIFDFNENTPLIYFAMNSLAYHQGNIDVMQKLGKMIEEKIFVPNIQLLIRFHPSYLSSSKEKKDMKALLAKLEKIKGIAINYPETVEESGLLFTQKDKDIQCSSFFHCTLTISSVSTFLIESAIFDKPAINLLCGTWKTNLYDIKIKDYIIQHLKRIYDYKCTYNIESLDELPTSISDILKFPQQREFFRKQLVNTEIPVNRGNSKKYFCDRIINLAKNNSKLS